MPSRIPGVSWVTIVSDIDVVLDTVIHSELDCVGVAYSVWYFNLSRYKTWKTDSASNLFCVDSSYSVRGVLCLCKRIIASEMIPVFKYRNEKIYQKWSEIFWLRIFRSYQGCIIEDVIKFVVGDVPTDRCFFKVKVFSPCRSDQQQDDLTNNYAGVM